MPEPSEDLFQQLYPYPPPSMFVDSDIDNLKSFEINRLLNRRTIKRGKDLAVEYLVYWTGYGPE